MMRLRLEIAHAAVADVLRDLDIHDPEHRRTFEDCLAAARLLGRALERLDELDERDEERAPEGEILLQVA